MLSVGILQKISDDMLNFVSKLHCVNVRANEPAGQLV